MHVGACRAEFRLHGNDSLKGKRQVARSIIAQLRRRFQLAAAEVEGMDEHQRLVIGFVCVSNSAAHVEEVLDKAERLIDSPQFDAELTRAERDVFRLA